MPDLTSDWTSISTSEVFPANSQNIRSALFLSEQHSPFLQCFKMGTLAEAGFKRKIKFWINTCFASDS